MHKKSHRVNTAERCYKTVNSNYGSHQSGLEGETSDKVCQENGSPVRVAEAPTVIEQNEEGLSGTVRRLAIRFSDILLRV